MVWPNRIFWSMCAWQSWCCLSCLCSVVMVVFRDCTVTNCLLWHDEMCLCVLILKCATSLQHCHLLQYFLLAVFVAFCWWCGCCDLLVLPDVGRLQPRRRNSAFRLTKHPNGYGENASCLDHTQQPHDSRLAIGNVGYL